MHSTSDEAQLSNAETSALKPARIRLPTQLIRWFGAALLLFVFSCYGALWLKNLVVPRLMEAVPPATHCCAPRAQVWRWYERTGTLAAGAFAGVTAAALSHVLFRKALKGRTIGIWYLGTILSMVLAFAIIFFGIEVVKATSGDRRIADLDVLLGLFATSGLLVGGVQSWIVRRAVQWAFGWCAAVVASWGSSAAVVWFLVEFFGD